MKLIRKADKLKDVCYDIRGPILTEAKRLEEEGHRILKLNIGNPAAFGFEAPEEIVHDVAFNLPQSQGYCDSKGIYSARKAIMQDCQREQITGVEIEDIYIGNGVSELIVMAMQASLNDGDEVLLPAPDYPLWAAAITLTGAKPVHYLCDETAEWKPDLDHLRASITKRTKALVVINPNNPTGAVYSRETLNALLEIAREHQLIVFADEIYSRILYDNAIHFPIASLADDLLIFTFSGLSKNWRAAGFRVGWLVISGKKSVAGDLIEGLDILASMRLCSNVPAQHAIQTALGGYQSLLELVTPGGLWYKQRTTAWSAINHIPGLSCVKPKGALYCFPKIDPEVLAIKDDEQMVLDLLQQERILVVQGTAFNWPKPDHFRLVFLPRPEELELAIQKLGHFLAEYTQ